MRRPGAVIVLMAPGAAAYGQTFPEKLTPYFVFMELPLVGGISDSR